MSKTPFVDALVQESLPIWQQCLDSDFLRGLEAGTLDEDVSRATSWMTACTCGNTPGCLPGV